MSERPIIFSARWSKPCSTGVLLMGRKRTGDGNEERRVRLDDDRLRSLFHEGHTAKEIAALLGCGIGPVKSAMLRLDLRRPAKRRPGKGCGSENPAWKGGRRLRKDGYVLVWTPSGARLEHQLVMEKHLGRPLADGEIVHHRDGNKANNVPDNLEIMSQDQHASLHAPELVAVRGGHRGHNNPRAKLTHAEMLEIRASGSSSRVLAAQYGVHPSTIQRIKSGKGWADEF